MGDMLKTQKNKNMDTEVSAANNTGIPDIMKDRYETLSGLCLDDVRVHYQSDKPIQLQALAYTQGNQVYIAPGQERHLPHELGHVLQQKRGNVQPTGFLNGLPVNDSPALEREADNYPQVMYAKDTMEIQHPPVIQRMLMNLEQFRELTERGIRGRSLVGKHNQEYYARLDRLIEEYHKPGKRTDAKIEILNQIMLELEFWQKKKPGSARNEVRGTLYQQAAEEIAKLQLEGGHYDEEYETQMRLEQWHKLPGVAEIEEREDSSEPLADRRREVYHKAVPLEKGTASCKKTTMTPFSEVLERLLYGASEDETIAMKKAFFQCIHDLLPYSTVKGIGRLINGASDFSGIGSYFLSNVPDLNNTEETKHYHEQMKLILARFQLMTKFMLDIATSIIPSTAGEEQPQRYGDRFLLESTGSDPHVGGKHAVFLYVREGYGEGAAPAKVYKAHDLGSDSRTAGTRAAGSEKTGVLSLMQTLLKVEEFDKFKNDYQRDIPELSTISFEQIGFATMNISEMDSMVEFAHKKQKMSQEEANSYDFNMGMLQAVAKAYCMLDLHQDNIMPVELGRGCAPLIVDGEVSFLQSGVLTGLQYAREVRGTNTSSFKVTTQEGETEHMANDDLILAGYKFFQSVISTNKQLLQESVEEQMKGLQRVRILPFATTFLLGLIYHYAYNVASGKNQEELDAIVRKMAEEGKYGTEVGLKGTIQENLTAKYFYQGETLKFYDEKYRQAIGRACKAGTIPAFELYLPEESLGRSAYILLDAPPGKMIPGDCVIAEITPRAGATLRQMLVNVRMNMIEKVSKESPIDIQKVFASASHDEWARHIGKVRFPDTGKGISKSLSMQNLGVGLDWRGNSTEKPEKKVRVPEIQPEDKGLGPVQQEELADLHLNRTAGDGNCFFHAMFEAMNGKRSTPENQQEMRERIINAILNDRSIRSGFFGTVRDGIDYEYLNQFINNLLTENSWVPDHSPYMMARIFNVNIVIHRPGGSILFLVLIGAPKTIHLQYTGNHYNSYTQEKL